MDNHWHMLTLIGKDSPGIVATISNQLYKNDCNLGETSMVRLGGNFTIMMMVSSTKTAEEIQQFMSESISKRNLSLHIDQIDAKLHQHKEADVSVRVYGADRAGIVAQVTDSLAKAGLNILDLMSDVAGTDEEPFYVMTLTGQAEQGIAELQKVAEKLSTQGIEIQVEAAPMLLA